MVMIRVEAIPDYVSCFIINNYSPPTQSILMNIYQDTVNIDQCSLSLRQIIVLVSFSESEENIKNCTK